MAVMAVCSVCLKEEKKWLRAKVRRTVNRFLKRQDHRVINKTQRSFSAYT